MAGRGRALSRFLHRLHRQDHGRSGPPTSAPSSATCCSPSDLPGLHFSASLKPSKTNAGASTLVVEVVEKPVDLHAAGSTIAARRRAGPNEFLLGATVNNLLQQHESLTLNWAGDGSAHPGARVFRRQLSPGAHQRRPLRLRQCELRLRPSRAPTRSSCSISAPAARTVEAGLASPLIRSREKNLTLVGPRLHERQLQRHLASSRRSSEDRLRGFRLKADGDWADRFLGINQVNVTYSQGIHGLGSSDNATCRRPPSIRRRRRASSGRVDFEKIEATLSRTQPLFGPFSAFGSIYGQYAFKPLLVPEQCGYGGRFFGRAYDPSELLGDHCLEARHRAALRPAEIRARDRRSSSSTRSADYGRLWLLAPASNDLAVGTPGNFTAASAGVGVRLALLEQRAPPISRSPRRSTGRATTPASSSSSARNIRGAR